MPECRCTTLRWEWWTHILWPKHWKRCNLPLLWTKKIYFSQGSGSGVKYFLHRQSALSATLFLAQAETAELTAVMSLALMECFVPQCVRMPPGFCASCETSVREPRWLTVAPFFKCKKTKKNPYLLGPGWQRPQVQSIALQRHLFFCHASVC